MPQASFDDEGPGTSELQFDTTVSGGFAVSGAPSDEELQQDLSLQIGQLSRNIHAFPSWFEGLREVIALQAEQLAQTLKRVGAVETAVQELHASRGVTEARGTVSAHIQSRCNVSLIESCGFSFVRGLWRVRGLVLALDYVSCDVSGSFVWCVEEVEGGWCCRCVGVRAWEHASQNHVTSFRCVLPTLHPQNGSLSTTCH